MIAVLLDASCLKREGLVSTSMLELTRLAENGRVVVVLSDIAVREYLSQHASELASHLMAAGKSLKTVERSLRILDPPTGDIDRLGCEIAALEAPLRDTFKDAFDAWAHRCYARRIAFDAACIHDVIEDYFTGKGAFRSQKSRTDFPDALILSSARAAASGVEQFHIVAGDERLRSAALEIDISPHESLIQFLEIPAVQKLRDMLANEQKIHDLATELLSVTNLDRIAEWLRTSDDQLEGIHLEHDEIAGLEEVGATVFGACIDYPVAREISSVLISLASPSSGGRWALALEFETLCRLEFVTSWSDSMELEGSRNVTIESADEVVELRESWRAHFEAEIVLDLSKREHGSEIGLPTIDSLQPELNVTRATLLRPA